MINQLQTESHKIGLKMNKSKTETMFSNLSHISPKIYVDKEELETVAHYIYLGEMIHMQGSQENEIKRRITMAWSKFGKMSEYLQDEKFPLSLKKKIFTQCVIPTLLYEAETWATTKLLNNKIRSTQLSMERTQNARHHVAG